MAKLASLQGIQIPLAKHDKKGSQTFQYSRLQMAETKMEAIRKATTTELSSEIHIYIYLFIYFCQGWSDM